MGLKSSLETIACLPIAGFEGRGKQINKLLYGMHLLAFAQLIVMVCYSFACGLKQCKHNLWLAVLCCLINLVVFWIRGWLELDDADLAMVVVLFFIYPGFILSILSVAINLVRILFGLGEALADPVIVPMILRITMLLLAVLFVITMLLVILEIRLIRRSEIVITDGAFEHIRRVVLSNKKEKAVEISPRLVRPKEVIRIPAFLKDDETKKELSEDVYQAVIDREQIRIWRDGKRIFHKANTNSELILFINPKGKHLQEEKQNV